MAPDPLGGIRGHLLRGGRGGLADLAFHVDAGAEGAVAAILKGCGIELQGAVSSLVPATDAKGLATVRSGFAAMKLGLTAEAADAGIKAAAEKMKANAGAGCGGCRSERAPKGCGRQDQAAATLRTWTSGRIHAAQGVPSAEHPERHSRMRLIASINAFGCSSPRYAGGTRCGVPSNVATASAAEWIEYSTV